MQKTHSHFHSRRLARPAYAAGLLALALALTLGLTGGVAVAAPLAATAPGLGAAASFSALGPQGVTNTGPSMLSGNVGANSSITGFSGPPNGSAAGLVFAPEVDPALVDAQAAYLALTAQAPGTPTGPNLTGLTLIPGTYSVGAALLPGTLTLDGPGVYVFLATALTSSGTVSLINGASPCDVFWQIDSSADITGGAFVGTIIANTSITFGNGTSLDGRALALTGNVTLINNAIFGPSCGLSGSGEDEASHVSVSYACVDDGRVAVTVGLSARVTVYGLGDAITVGQDTGENRIVRYLTPGRYEWHATPPAGHYMLDVDHGVIDVANCTPAAIAAAALIPAPVATVAGVAPVLFPATGADSAEAQALASRQAVRLGLGALGLGLVLAGLTLRRKQSK